MKNALISAMVAAALAAPLAARAEQRTATIEVSGLFCASCPYIAAQAITDVPSASITGGYYDPASQMAQFIVEFDDQQATLEQLIAAPADYGYPARLVEAAAPAENS